MTKLLGVLFISLSLMVTMGCSHKKPKPEAESNESRKGRTWDYKKAEENMQQDEAEAAKHKDCKPILEGAYKGYYQNGTFGQHLEPHHDNCRPVDESKGLGEGYFENDELGPHAVGHKKP